MADRERRRDPRDGRAESRAGVCRLAVRARRGALWLLLHASGVHAALAGVILAAFLPTRPAPAAGPLLAQAATALAALEHRENEARERGDGRVAHRAGADLGVGEPQSFRCERAASFAGRSRRACGCAVERLCDPAAVRIFGDRHQPCRRRAFDRGLARACRRRSGPRARQAARYPAGVVARDQGGHRTRAARRRADRICRCRMPVRRRRYRRTVVGRSGVSAWRRRGRGKDRRADRLDLAAVLGATILASARHSARSV